MSSKLGFKQLSRILILLFIVCSLTTQHLQAQSFLLCKQPIKDQQEPTASLFENHGEIRMVLHALMGDDLLAFLGSNPDISEFRSEQANAFSIGPNRIFLTSSLLEMISSSSELAFVLAHEVAHLKYDRQGIHMFLAEKGANQQEKLLNIELKADFEALNMLKKSGFDTSAGSVFLKRIKDLSQGSGPNASFYLNLESRILALSKL